MTELSRSHLGTAKVYPDEQVKARESITAKTARNIYEELKNNHPEEQLNEIVHLLIDVIVSERAAQIDKHNHDADFLARLNAQLPKI